MTENQNDDLSNSLANERVPNPMSDHQHQANPWKKSRPELAPSPAPQNLRVGENDVHQPARVDENDPPDLFEKSIAHTGTTPTRARKYFNAGPAASSTYDENAYTPWKRHRAAQPDDKARRGNLIRFGALTTAFAFCLFAVMSLSFVCKSFGWSNQQALGWMTAQVGASFGNNAMIKSGYNAGWGNNPNGVPILLGLANNRAAQDKKAAMELYDEIVRINPRYANGWMNRGLNYALMGNWDRALVEYNKAIELNPNYALAYNNKGAIYSDRRLYSAALECFNKAIALDPKRFDYPFNRALLFKRTGEKQKALRDLDIAEQNARTPEARVQVFNLRDEVKREL